MKNYKIFIYIALVIILLFVIAVFFINQNLNNSTPYTDDYGSKISTVINEEKTNDDNNTNISNIPKEEEISSYATTIKDNSSGRLTNISITCSVLNNTIIKPNETFSFNNIVGQPTVEKGYQEASVIIDHKTEKGIGGGNCQVSSTLYNAVLNVPTLVVTERHEHGKDVTYVPEGKDAAVSFGSLDLKFRNDTGNDIKILASTDNQSVTIRLIKIIH